MFLMPRSVLDLPNELLRHIAEYVGLNDYMRNVAYTCSTFYNLVNIPMMKLCRTKAHTPARIAIAGGLEECIEYAEDMILRMREDIADRTPGFCHVNKCVFDCLSTHNFSYGFLKLRLHMVGSDDHLQRPWTFPCSMFQEGRTMLDAVVRALGAGCMYKRNQGRCTHGHHVPEFDGVTEEEVVHVLADASARVKHLTRMREAMLAYPIPNCCFAY